MELEPVTNATNEPKKQTDWSALVLVGITFIWLVTATLGIHWTGWLVDQVIQNVAESWPPWTWFVISIGHGFVLLLPFLLAALVWKNHRYQGVFKSWLLAIAYVFLMAPIRLVQPLDVQLANLLQIILTAIFILFLLLIAKRQGQLKRQRPSFNQITLAMLLAAIPTFPWLLWGALGSPMDTALNLLAALLFGLAAGLIIAFILMPSIYSTSNGKTWDLTLTGFAIGALLLIMSASLGFNGLQLLLMFVLPGLGWAAAVLGYPDNAGRPERLLAPALFIGLAVAGPALFIDPDEFALVLGLGGRDLLTWAFVAALVAMLISWAVSLSAVIARSATNRRLPRPLTMGALAFFGLLGLLLYFFVGQPGFHGEQLFVILTDQADLSTAESMTDYDARRQFVYDTLVANANRSQSDIRSSLDSFGIDYTPYYLVNALAVEGGPIIRLWLNSRPEVDRILDNPILRPLPAQAQTAQSEITSITPGPHWNQTLIGADRVWSEFDVTGQGMVIGQSDSGVQGDHLELIDTYRGQETSSDYNWLDPWNQTAVPTDIGGHGTHTLGSIVGQNTGIAPDAQWIGCVNLARNLANPALYLDCMQFMLAPYPLGGDPFTDGRPDLSAHVLNNSWGCPPIEGCDPEALVAGVQALRAAGIFVVVSAGNSGMAGCGSVTDPLALYDEVFSVGAINQSGNLADFSSLGPVTVDGSGRTKPDIVAPGEDVLSAFPNSTYQTFSGTSMAGPHVAGVVALIWSANPALIGQIDKTEEILIETAQTYTGSLPSCAATDDIPNNGSGYGIVDAYAAVQMALEQAP